jgi:hypothetical protein
VRYRTEQILHSKGDISALSDIQDRRNGDFTRVPDLHALDSYGPVQARVLQRALQKVGNMAILAAVLRAPCEALQDWLAGTEALPDEVFLTAVDLITSKVNLADPYSRS